jgi:hypothetical protein
MAGIGARLIRLREELPGSPERLDSSTHVERCQH